MAILAVTVGLLALQALPQAQGGPSLSEGRVRALARQARTEARGDATTLILDLDRRIRQTWGEFESFPLSLVKRDDLLITLSAPYMAYRRSIVDVLRTNRRVEDAVWVDAVVVTVSPSRLGAPDVLALTLTRDGREVAPTKSLLRPMTFSDGGGSQTTLHAGDIHFPAAAFAPGATVVLTIRPQSGEPFVYRFAQAELESLK